jgi:hypothetical protein
MHNFTDENFPVRKSAMTPRLQSKIPKMLGWSVAPNYDFYVWMDSYFVMTSPDTVQWFSDACIGYDVVFFEHPDRNSIREELSYMEGACGNYISSRYGGEPMNGQVRTYLNDEKFVDDRLYAGGVFAYKSVNPVKSLLAQWFIHCSLYSVQDQLSLPYLLSKDSHIRVRVIRRTELSLLANTYFRYTE